MKWYGRKKNCVIQNKRSWEWVAGKTWQREVFVDQVSPNCSRGIALFFLSAGLQYIISVIAVVFCPPPPPWHRGDNLASMFDTIFKKFRQAKFRRGCYQRKSLWISFYIHSTLCKGNCQKRFSGFCPSRGYPPPYPLNGKSVWKKKVFFLNGIGGYPPKPLNGKSVWKKEGFFP